MTEQTVQTPLPAANTVECMPCGVELSRDSTLKLGPSKWTEPDTDEDDFVCPRCGLLALRGGPENNPDLMEAYQ